MTTRRNFLKTMGVAAGAAVLGAPAIVKAQPVHRWRVQTLWGAGDLPQKLFEEFCEKLKKRTNGRLEITPFTAGTIVGAFETLDAVGTGVIQGQSTYPGYWAGKEPALAVIGDFAFGYTDPKQQDEWFRRKGGLALMREIYSRFNVHYVGGGWWGVESISSKKPLRNMADFKGIKHRAAHGIAAEVISKMGASIVVIPGGEAYSALDKGVVDSVDWATISINARVGFFEIAKYATYPGFHSMPVQDFTVNKAAWTALPDDVKAIVESTHEEFVYEQVKRIADEDARVAKEIQQKGVTLVSWDQEELRKVRRLAVGVWEEWGKKSPMARKAVDSQVAWLKEIKLL